MPYSVNLLNTAAECDALLDSLNQDKEELVFRKISLERQRRNYQHNSVSITAELQAVTAEMAALTTILAGLPDGDLKNENSKNLRKAELRKYLLQDRQKNYGAIAVIDREVEISRASQQMTEVDAAITEVETWKTGL